VADRATALRQLEEEPSVVTLIELAEEPRWTLVRRKQPSDDLAVIELQDKILKRHAGLSQEAIDNKTNIHYPHTIEEFDAIDTPIQAAFFLRAVTPPELARVVDSGEFMPQKSTYFYPKLLSGLVFHEFALQ
jgi:uncharacterized protein (DUF1015 family)